MADLSLGLAGLALLPTLFFLIAVRLGDELKTFKIAFMGMGFITLLIFISYSAGFISTPEQIWGLFVGVVALFIIYLWIEVINILVAAAKQAMEKIRR